MLAAQAAPRDRTPQHGAVAIALRLVVKELSEAHKPARRAAGDQCHVERSVRPLPAHDHLARGLDHGGLDAFEAMSGGDDPALPFERAELDRLPQGFDLDDLAGRGDVVKLRAATHSPRPSDTSRDNASRSALAPMP